MWAPLAVAALSGAVLVQVSAPPVMDFGQLRSLARERYPALKAARFGAQAAGQRVKGAGAWADPMVGVQLWNMPLNHVEGAFMPGMMPEERVVNFLRGPDMIPIMVMGQQTFPWPGKRGAEVEEAGARAEQDASQVASVQADVDRAVAYAFAEHVASERMLDALKSTADILDAVVVLSDARARAALGTPMDALSARVERDSLERDILDAQQQRALARARLAALTGVSNPAALHLANENMELPTLPERSLLLQKALEARPELKGARAAVAAATARARRQSLEALPDVTANVSYMANFGGLGMALDKGPYDALLGGPDMVTVGVSVPLPVFAPWKQNRLADAARLDARRADAEVEALIAVIQSDMDAALAGVEHAKGHLELHGKKLIPLAQSSVELAQSQYQTGGGSVFNMLQAVKSLRGHQLDLIASQVEMARHVADLERATGVPLVRYQQVQGVRP